MIDALPGRKFIFTNGTQDHATRVATRLGISDLFHDIFDIVSANYVPKPNAQIYPDMLAQFGIEAGRSAFFEDMARNLPPARARHDHGFTARTRHARLWRAGGGRTYRPSCAQCERHTRTHS